MTEAAAPLLEVEDLEVAFPHAGRGVPVVRGAALTVGRGEAVGLVGESGSGKTLTALAVLRLVPPPGRVSGRVRLNGDGDLLALSERAMRRVRGGRIGYVFQEPMAALDPVYSVGFQIARAVRAHRRIAWREARPEAARLIDRVALPDARRRLDDYPHQLSGGQRQRVGIALALAAGPDLLLADEPTTALDVTLQAQILDLLAQLRAELGLAVLLITHDLGVVAEACDRAVVMHRGEVVETADVAALFRAPRHPYTRALLASLPATSDVSDVLDISDVSGVPDVGGGRAGSAGSEGATGSSQSPKERTQEPADPRPRGGPDAAPLAAPIAATIALSREFRVRRGLFRRTRGVVRPL